jgi:hypothetical protein
MPWWSWGRECTGAKAARSASTDFAHAPLLGVERSPMGTGRLPTLGWCASGLIGTHTRELSCQPCRRHSPTPCRCTAQALRVARAHRLRCSHVAVPLRRFTAFSVRCGCDSCRGCDCTCAATAVREYCAHVCPWSHRTGRLATCPRTISLDQRAAQSHRGCRLSYFSSCCPMTWSDTQLREQPQRKVATEGTASRASRSPPLAARFGLCLEKCQGTSVTRD